jgi:lipoprotein-releasing system ATP-binding protein
VIKAESIYKSYGDLTVLKNVSLEIEKGEVISIVGASGAGKTTLLQILGTLEQADEGIVEMDGVVVNRLSEKEQAQFRNHHLGFIFQFHHLLPEFTAIENVCIPAMIDGKSKSQITSRAEELLGMLGLSERLNHKPSELSGGEQQRIAVARSLINSPKLILADEPSGNLDTENARALHELFFRLRDEFGHTVVIVTHNDELADMADRKLVMRDGEIISENRRGA